jgi:UDPglucose 6-dehydrogenase
MKVSYANEVYQLCNALEIDYDKVIEYARYDDRLGNSHWSVPGPDGDFGFGGHCFPKDIAALVYVAETLGVDSTMLDSNYRKNEIVRTDKDWEKQIGRAVSKN